MTTRLTDLADVCRSAGLAVIEVDGWQTRSRRGGTATYAPGRPTHVMVHHTASRTTPANDVAYICHGSKDAPLGNLLLDRDGIVHVCAAGPTNTNGAGSSRPWSGGVPDDQMNEYAIGIEAANNGTGELWPAAQCHAYIVLCAALGRRYGIPIGHVRAHAEWAPGRKIDPAGPSPWAPAGGTWNMDAFRSDVLVWNPTPPLPTPTGEPEVIALDHRPGTPEWTAYSWTGTQLAHVFDGNADNVMRAANVPRVTVTDEQLTGVVRSSQCVTAPPPTLPAAAVPVWD